MKAFSALLAFCAGNSPVTGEFPAQRPVMRNFDVFFDLRPNQQFSKQWIRRWFGTLLRSLWCHCNDSPFTTSALVHEVAWHRKGDTLLQEPWLKNNELMLPNIQYITLICARFALCCVLLWFYPSSLVIGTWVIIRSSKCQSTNSGIYDYNLFQLES